MIKNDNILEAIRGKKSCNFLHLKENKKIYNIGYGIDDNYARCAGVSIVSICKNNIDANLSFHIIASSLSMENINKLEAIAKTNKVDINMYFIDESFFSQLPTREYFPIAMYYRLILPMLINDSDLLYLDADVICLQNISTLFENSRPNFAIAAARDIDNTGNKRAKALNLVHNTYFNSGVLYINTEKWKQNNIINKVLDVLIKNKEALQYPDQDALNVVFKNETYLLERKWNWINTSDDVNIDEIIFIHFTAHPKPWSVVWQYRSPLILRDIYDKYEKVSPWCNERLDLPVKYKHMKWYAYGLINEGRYLEGIRWYILYLKTKYGG